MVAFLLVIVGGVNWGLIGVAGFDLVAWVFVDLLAMETLARIIYILVGLAAIYEVLVYKSSGVRSGASNGMKQNIPSADGPDMPGAM